MAMDLEPLIQKVIETAHDNTASARKLQTEGEQLAAQLASVEQGLAAQWKEWQSTAQQTAQALRQYRSELEQPVELTLSGYDELHQQTGVWTRDGESWCQGLEEDSKGLQEALHQMSERLDEETARFSGAVDKALEDQEASVVQVETASEQLVGLVGSGRAQARQEAEQLARQLDALEQELEGCEVEAARATAEVLQAFDQCSALIAGQVADLIGRLDQVVSQGIERDAELVVETARGFEQAAESLRGTLDALRDQTRVLHGNAEGDLRVTASQAASVLQGGTIKEKHSGLTGLLGLF